MVTVFTDPDPNTVYAEGGVLVRFDKTTGQRVGPAAGARNESAALELGFAFVISPLCTRAFILPRTGSLRTIAATPKAISGDLSRA